MLAYGNSNCTTTKTRSCSEHLPHFRSGCRLLGRHPSFHLVADVVYAVADRTADFRAARRREQNAGPNAQSYPGGEAQDIVAEGVIFLRVNCALGPIRDLRSTIRYAVHLLGGLIHDINGRFQKRLE